MLKMSPSWPNALSTTAEDAVYSLQFFLRKLLKSRDAHSSHTIHQFFFVIDKELVNKSWIFCTATPDVLRIHGSTQGKPGFITEKHELWINFSIVHILKKPIIQMYSSNRLTFLQTFNCRCLNTVADVTILLPSVPTFSKHSSPWALKFSVTFHSRMLFDTQLHQSWRYSTLYLHQATLLHHWQTETNLPAINKKLFTTQVCYRPQLKFHLGLGNIVPLYVGHLESKERFRIQPAQLFNCSWWVMWCVQ